MSNFDFDFDRYGRRIMQYFWDPLPSNDDPSASPIWLLGRQYDATPPRRETQPPAPPALPSHHSIPSELSTSEGSTGSWVDGGNPGDDAGDLQQQKDLRDHNLAEADAGWPREFLDDFESRIWLTYRSNFEPIPKSTDPKAAAAMSLAMRLKSQLAGKDGFTTDTGYGCMIRTGQSLLANALLLLRLGRDWRRGHASESERRILSYFADDPKAPFSVHRFVEHGATACGKHPGEWFGPSATARCIQALANTYETAGLRVYITGDGSEVYEDSFFKIAKSTDGAFKPTLLLVGIRLGLDRITPVYWESLKAILQLSQAVGIAGGRPSASHYFVGTQGQNFFYLDPHHTRPAFPYRTDIKAYTDEDIDSCHTRRLRRIHISDMDPSMLIGFLIRDEGDWRAWKKAITEVDEKPAIHVGDQQPTLHGHGYEREGAIDEVENWGDTDEETVL